MLYTTHASEDLVSSKFVKDVIKTGAVLIYKMQIQVYIMVESCLLQGPDFTCLRNPS